MVIVMLRNGKEFTIAENVKTNIDILLNDVKTAKMDLVIVIDGGEGTGKSFMARGLGMYCATFLDSPFGVDDIYFDAQSYINASLTTGSYETAGYHKINVLDEGRHVLNRKRGMSGSNIQFTNYLSECRSLGQVHIILCPAMHDLDKNIVMWRMNMLFHAKKNYVKSKESDVGLKMKRGQYYLYTSKSAIGYCYETFGYKYPSRWEARSTWNPREVFSAVQMQEYEEKKNAATVAKYATKEEKEEAILEEHKNMLNDTDPANLILLTKAAREIGAQPVTLKKWIKKGDVRGKMIGSRWYIHREVFTL